MADRMRSLAPESSIAPADVQHHAIEFAQKRLDKRESGEQRAIYLNTGVVSQARGSAYIEYGRTKIMAACYGPRDILRGKEYSSKGKLNCDFKFAPFSSVSRKGYLQDDEEREFSAILEQTLLPSICLERYPKSTIDVFVTVLEDDGSVLAGAITCASAALAAAGFEMRDLVAACGMVWQQGNYLDPTYAEERAAMVRGTIACMASMGEVCGLVVDGLLPHAAQNDLLREAVSGCARVHAAMQHALRAAGQRQLHRLQQAEIPTSEAVAMST